MEAVGWKTDQVWEALSENHPIYRVPRTETFGVYVSHRWAEGPQDRVTGWSNVLGTVGK